MFVQGFRRSSQMTMNGSFSVPENSSTRTVTGRTGTGRRNPGSGKPPVRIGKSRLNTPTRWLVQRRLWCSTEVVGPMGLGPIGLCTSITQLAIFLNKLVAISCTFKFFTSCCLSFLRTWEMKYFVELLRCVKTRVYTIHTFSFFTCFDVHGAMFWFMLFIISRPWCSATLRQSDPPSSNCVLEFTL